MESSSIVKRAISLVLLTALAGCGTTFHAGGPALVSANTPAAANSQGAEPQPANSLPPGAEGMGTGPNARVGDYGALTFRSPYL